MQDKVIYQNKEFFVKGSIVAECAIAEASDGFKGVFNVKTGSLIDGLFSPEWFVQLFFDEVNNLMARSGKVGQKERLVVIHGDTEPI